MLHLKNCTRNLTVIRNALNFKISYSSLKGNGVVGIRREDKNRWERRAPIAPTHVSQLVSRGVKVLMQPSTLRVFPDNKYEEVGAIISEDISEASVILGVKEVPIDKLIPERTYCFFSHTHKGQPHNMPLLDAILEKNIRLIDYERIVDADGHRLVKFGKFAGYAGMIDFLHGLGNRLLARGYATPFLNVGFTHMYSGFESACAAVEELGKLITLQGIPQALCPLVFVFTGTGAVSSGAQEIFQLLPHKWVKPNQLRDLVYSGNWENNVLYGTIASSDSIVAPNDPSQKFSRIDYYKHPEKYHSTFADNIAPYASVIVNSLYWDSKFPRLLSNQQLEELESSGRNRLIGVADLSCDIEGSIESLKEISSIDHPLYVYDVEKREVSYDIVNQKGILFLAVDNLPTEIPFDATKAFGDALIPWIEDIVNSDGTLPVEKSDLPKAIQEAVITSHGRLAPNYEYITAIRAENSRKEAKMEHKILLLGTGMMSKAVVDFFVKKRGTSITVASNDPSQALQYQRHNVEVVHVDASDPRSVAKEVERHDIVISLLPASLHAQVARVCIEHKKPMVTSSYISPEMKSLNESAIQAGVTILNECGLDPGIDHISAMKIILDAKKEGHEVTSFISYCGGLPAPEHSDNPFGYKFSWSPKGVLLAAKNGAKYKFNERIVEVPEGEALNRVTDIDYFPGFSLEGYPNRDSLSYADSYGLRNAQTFLRGTLRYKGTSLIFSSLNRIGYLDSSPNPLLELNASPITWKQLTQRLLSDAGSLDLGISVLRKLGLTEPGTEKSAGRVNRAFQWLGLYSDENVPQTGNLLDAVSQLLQQKLKYEKNERDLVVMKHNFTIRLPSGKKEDRSSTLVVYGDENYSAMAKTVGIPLALAAQLILEGHIIRKGVLSPLTPDIVYPLANNLEREGIYCSEKSTDFS
eukprot:TRINITY_DN15441_c0_g1_i1.p1 TRINITY_DN15441_c0_g1~~TRINITY_DN15441_c0_g1_i1.p1  ORF type:complete len:923 (-),score=158.70 TRINITY_DN15441_c0_g1_i1:152-2920(-)